MPGTQVFSQQTVVPVNGVATIILPAQGPASAVDILEGGTTVWKQGTYVPGVPGISGGEASADGKSVVFTVGSGSYSFVVLAPSS